MSGDVGAEVRDHVAYEALEPGIDDELAEAALYDYGLMCTELAEGGTWKAAEREQLRRFDPTAEQQTSEVPVYRRGDQRPAKGYVDDKEGRIALAINVALVTGRPLLIRGKPGTGKSSLAADVAEWMGWRFYSRTVTSRTRARELLWSYDAVRRLNDANANARNAQDPASYVTPGVLWWAFQPESAATRGLSAQAFLRSATSRG